MIACCELCEIANNSVFNDLAVGYLRSKWATPSAADRRVLRETIIVYACSVTRERPDRDVLEDILGAIPTCATCRS